METKRIINLRDLKARIGIYKRVKFASKEKTLVTKGDLYPCELLAQRMSTVATAIIYLPTRMYISACKKSADGFGEKAKIDRLLKKIFAIETPCNTIDSIKIEKYEKFERYSNDIEFKIYLSPVVLRISLNSLIVMSILYFTYTRA